MPRSKIVIWEYQCDAPGCPGDEWADPLSLRVQRGQACSTGRGTVVHDQADADAHVRSRGWTVGRRVLCPYCSEGGA